MNHLELLGARTRNQMALSQQIHLTFLHPIAMNFISVPLVPKRLFNTLVERSQCSNIHLALALLVSNHEFLVQILSL